jgi:hypothetical protein
LFRTAQSISQPQDIRVDTVTRVEKAVANLRLLLLPCDVQQGVQCINPFLRTVNFGSASLTEIRQAPPLPAVQQPDNGHRLVYYVISGMYLCREDSQSTNTIRMHPALRAALHALVACHAFHRTTSLGLCSAACFQSIADYRLSAWRLAG